MVAWTRRALKKAGYNRPFHSYLKERFEKAERGARYERLWNRLKKRGDLNNNYAPPIYEALELMGNLCGKKVLLIAPRSGILSYLSEVEKAKVTCYAGGRIDPGVQELDKRLAESGFNLVLGNAVFEEHAFLYNEEYLLPSEVTEVMNKREKSPGFQKYVKKLRGVPFPKDFFERRSYKSPKEAIEKERHKAEREYVLKQIASKMNKGGYFIYTGSSSKTIFTSQEATRTGFKILKLNWPVSGEGSNKWLSVLQKK
ncbi:MAG: hypothetical protein NTY48_06175 [Candidatus Diapherotrites archaeon]|nr:hypothetical protein [Candidatus Diapherotrites archaeon]